MDDSKKITVSLGQMDVKFGDVDINLATMKAMTAVAVRQGSDLIVFPELWSTGYDLQSAEECATPTNDGMFSTVASIAREQQIAIIGSTLSRLGEGQYGNTAVYFDHQGKNLGEFLVLADETEGVWTAELDLTLVQSVRKSIPVFEDRRPDLY